MTTYRQLLKQGEQILKEASIEDYSFDALQLLLHITGFSNNDFLLFADKEVPYDETEKFLLLIKRRKHHEPLQYIIGKWSFFESEFYVGNGVLIPRPETEELVELCVDYIKNNDCKTVFDLCTGSGCIGLSLAKKFPHINFYLFDLFDEALYYAEKNLMSLKLDNVTIVKCDITKTFDSRLPQADVIVSNPPYIRTDEIKDLQAEVQKEPVTALDGGNDGLIFYRSVNSLWLSKLKTDGLIAVECGETQTEDIISIFSQNCDCKAYKDLNNVDRFVVGTKK